jgi:hypothetical protein
MKEYKINLYIPPSLIEAIGLKESILLSELLEHQRVYFFDGLAGNGLFPCSVEEMESRTNLSRGQQGRIIEKLEALGLIEVSIYGKGIKFLAVRNFFVKDDCREIMDRLMCKGSHRTDNSNSPKQGNKLKNREI